MKNTVRSLAVSVVAALAFGFAPAARADGWIYVTENTWYVSYLTCMSRGQALIETGQYKGPRTCTRNTYTASDGTFRWTLKLWRWVNGSGGGGGGFGSWAFPERGGDS